MRRSLQTIRFQQIGFTLLDLFQRQSSCLKHARKLTNCIFGLLIGGLCCSDSRWICNQNRRNKLFARGSYAILALNHSEMQYEHSNVAICNILHDRLLRTHPKNIFYPLLQHSTNRLRKFRFIFQQEER